MRQILKCFSAALLFGALGCDKPAPDRVPPPTVPPVDTQPEGADINIDAGNGRGVDVKVDVDPAPGGQGVKVDIDRPNDPAQP